jgi:hypothetical protein
VATEQLTVTAGFPEFWQRAHDKFPLFFNAARDLADVQNEIFKKPVCEPLDKVLRHIAKIVSNSLGAVITLVLNGYGNDAIKICRSMFEGAVVTGYLKHHPETLEDYLEWHWVGQKRLYEYMEKHYPDGLRRMDPKAIAEMKREFSAAKTRFAGKRGRLRSSWSKKSLRQMAEEVGMGQLYQTFYFIASSMHHLDFGGLSAQSEKESMDADIAPSEEGLEQALIIAHGAVLHCLTHYNEAAKLRMDCELEIAAENFKRAWGK